MTEAPNFDKRVVITGCGYIGADANNGTRIPNVIIGVDDLWDKLISGHTTYYFLPDHICKKVYNFSPDDPHVGSALPEDFDPLATATAWLAMENAGLSQHLFNPYETGVAISSSSGPIDLIEEALTYLLDRELSSEVLIAENPKQKVTNLKKALMALVRNGLAGETVRVVAKTLGVNGIPLSINAACASSAANLMIGADTIRNGHAEVMFVGGTESMRSKAWLEAFRFGRLFAENGNNNPSVASRAGDADRSGLVPAEMSAVLVLEDLDKVRKDGREDKILAEVLQGGAAQDPGGVVLVDHTAIKHAMRTALRRSQLLTSGTDLIIPHMPSTIHGDEIEAHAISIINPNATIYALKSNLGHGFASAAGTNAIVAGRCLREGIIPQQVNLFIQGTRLDDGNVEPGKLAEVIFARDSHSGKRDPQVAQINGIGMQGEVFSINLKKYES